MRTLNNTEWGGGGRLTWYTRKPTVYLHHHVSRYLQAASNWFSIEKHHCGIAELVRSGTVLILGDHGRSGMSC